MGLVLGLMGSPRRGGNSEIMLEHFLKGFQKEVLIEVIRVGELEVAPCQGCRFCEENGFCKISDGMNKLYELFREADLIVVSSPIFFYGVPSQLKAIIDRSQALWARRYRFNLRDPKSPWRKGIALCVGATRGKNLFLGVELTFKYFFDAIGASFEGVMGYREADKKGDILRQKNALEELESRGKAFMEAFKQKKKILFVCRGNSGRSQMAEAFLQYHGGDLFEAYSAGSTPKGKILPEVTEVMAEKGLDLFFRKPKEIESVLKYGPFDLLITMGCEEVCPIVEAKRTLNWNLEDPEGKTISTVREIRDKIEEGVKKIIMEVRNGP